MFSLRPSVFAREDDWVLSFRPYGHTFIFMIVNAGADSILPQDGDKTKQIKVILPVDNHADSPYV
jgi:hypothetical protein